jgi:hypothetical protein
MKSFFNRWMMSSPTQVVCPCTRRAMEIGDRLSIYWREPDDFLKQETAVTVESVAK